MAENDTEGTSGSTTRRSQQRGSRQQDQSSEPVTQPTIGLEEFKKEFRSMPEEVERKLGGRIDEMEKLLKSNSQTVNEIKESISTMTTTTQPETTTTDSDAAAKPSDEHIIAEGTRAGIERTARDAGKGIVHTVRRGVGAVIPSNRKELFEFVLGYGLGFVTGTRVATSDWFENALEEGVTR